MIHATPMLPILFPVLTALTALAPAQLAGPRDVIRTATEAVVQILNDTSLDDTQKTSRAEGVVDRHLDTATVSQLVLARTWRSLDESQRDAFVGEFRRYLVATYWKNVNGLEIDGVTIDEDREEARGDWTVKTTVRSNRFGDTSVDYRLRREERADGTPGEWRIIDILVEDISLISNFRSQFKEVLAGKSFDDLMTVLREKNTKGGGSDT